MRRPTRTAERTAKLAETGIAHRLRAVRCRVEARADPSRPRTVASSDDLRRPRLRLTDEPVLAEVAGRLNEPIASS